MEKKEGKLIVIEGACDGIGKTTQYEVLYKYLIDNNFDVIKHHFPSYGEPQAATVEKYLKGEYGLPKDLSPYFVNSLYATDRAGTWYSELKNLYEQGNIILLDRYTTSSLIYQSALIDDIEEKKKFIDFVIDYEYKKIGIKEPDQVIFLHAPFDLVTELRNARKENSGITNDIHEKDLEFMKKVYESAMFIADYLSWDKIQCNYGENMRSVNDIHEQICHLVRTKE